MKKYVSEILYFLQTFPHTTQYAEFAFPQKLNTKHYFYDVTQSRIAILKSILKIPQQSKISYVCCLACSSRSECGYSAKRCEQENQWGSGVGLRAYLPLFLLIFFPALFLRAPLHYLNTLKRLFTIMQKRFRKDQPLT